MKARKRFNHNDLIAEIAKQLTGRFNPTPQVSIYLSIYLIINLINLFYMLIFYYYY
jgi:hypothetical protein